MFGFFKKKSSPTVQEKELYPVLTPDMIKPINEPLDTVSAKKIYRSYMSQINYCVKDELSESVKYFALEIKQETEFLKEEIFEKKDEIKELNEQIKSLKSKVKLQNIEEKEETVDAIFDMQEDIEYLLEELDSINKKYKYFKKDKRNFLVKYINKETQAT